MSHFPLLQNWENTENIIGFTWYCNRADVYNMPYVWEIFNTFQLNYIFVWVLPRTKLEKALGCRVVSDIMVYLGGEPLKQKRQLQEWVKEGRNVHTKKICWGHCCEKETLFRGTFWKLTGFFPELWTLKKKDKDIYMKKVFSPSLRMSPQGC